MNKVDYEKEISNLNNDATRLNEIAKEKQQEIERLNKELQDTKEHLGEYLHEQEEENKRLNNIINELEKDIENKITFCSNEANGSINNKLCKISIQYLEHLKKKLQELKGSDKK